MDPQSIGTGGTCGNSFRLLSSCYYGFDFIANHVDCYPGFCCAGSAAMARQKPD
jgi:hypothetical protein